MDTKIYRSAYNPLFSNGTIIEVDDSYEIRLGYMIRKFRFIMEGAEDAKNNQLEMQLDRKKCDLIDKSFVGKKVNVEFFLNGMESSTKKRHVFISCVNVRVLEQ